MYGNGRNGRHLGFWGYWSALAAAVALTHAENYQRTVFQGCRLRRLAKLVFWVLPAVWFVNSAVIFLILHAFAGFPAVAFPLGLIMAGNAALQTLKYAKLAIFG